MVKVKIKAKDLREKSREELDALLSGEREKFLNLRIRSGESKSKNVKEASGIKKNIARILTVLN